MRASSFTFSPQAFKTFIYISRALRGKPYANEIMFPYLQEITRDPVETIALLGCYKA